MNHRRFQHVRVWFDIGKIFLKIKHLVTAAGLQALHSEVTLTTAGGAVGQD